MNQEISMASKLHLQKEGETHTTLCSMVLIEPDFSKNVDKVTCKKCLSIHRLGRYHNPKEPAHQAALRRRKMLGDLTVFECSCKKLFASVIKFEGNDAAPTRCFACRKARGE